jgi:hypothetical protein
LIDKEPIGDEAEINNVWIVNVAGDDKRNEIANKRSAGVAFNKKNGTYQIRPRSIAMLANK